MSEFDTVTAGAELGISNRWSTKIVKVERVTASQIIIEGGERYNKRTGRRVGETEYSGYYLVALNEAKERIESDRAERRARNIKAVAREAKSAFRVRDSEVPALLRQIADALETTES